MRSFFLAGLIVFFLVPLLTGCGPGLRRVRLPAETYARQPSVHLPSSPLETGERVPKDISSKFVAGAKEAALPDLGQVEQRLSVYEERQKRWNALGGHIRSLDMGEPLEGWEDCMFSLEQTTYSYRKIREKIVYQNTEMTGEEDAALVSPWSAAMWDVDFFERGCNEVFDRGVDSVSGWISRFSAIADDEVKAVVGKYAGNEQYEQAVRAYQDLVASFPELSEDPEMKKIYGLTLVREGKLEEAARVFQAMLPDVEAEKGPWGRRRLTADLFLASGLVDEAKEQYRTLDALFTLWREDEHWVASQLDLIESAPEHPHEFALYTAVLRSYMTFDGKSVPAALRNETFKLEESFPESLFSEQARQLLATLEEKATSWVHEQLTSVDSLVAGKEYRKAAGILEALLDSEISFDLREVVSATLNNVLSVEEEERKSQQLLLEQNLAIQWEEASRLLDRQQYDDAIVAFSGLVGTSYDESARRKMAEASESAATTMRKRAAAFFVKARRANSTEYQKKLLLESRQLLRQILQKYPDVGIKGKVLQNLKVLEEQIRVMDPHLLDAADRSLETGGRLPEQSGPVTGGQFPGQGWEEEKL